MNTYGQAGALADGKIRAEEGVRDRTCGPWVIRTPSIVALDGDVKNSTYAEYFLPGPRLGSPLLRVPDSGTASHIVRGGTGFGRQDTVRVELREIRRARGYDQFEMGFISRLNIKVVGSHVGVNIAADGPSQMALADVAFFRSMAKVQADAGGPGLYILNPSDAVSAYGLTRADGGAPWRLLPPRRKAGHAVSSTTWTPSFTLGGHGVLAEGGDVLIAASGYAVHEATKGNHGTVGARHQGHDSSTCTRSLSTARQLHVLPKPAAATSSQWRTTTAQASGRKWQRRSLEYGERLQGQADVRQAHPEVRTLGG